VDLKKKMTLVEYKRECEQVVKGISKKKKIHNLHLSEAKYAVKGTSGLVVRVSLWLITGKALRSSNVGPPEGRGSSKDNFSKKTIG